MRGRVNLLVFAFVIVVLVYFGWWASLGYPPEITVCEPAGTAEKCAAHYPPVGAIRWVLFQLDRYGVLLTAVFTGFIAWFTIVLARTSANQTELTQRIERPYLFVVSTGFPEREILEFNGWNDDTAGDMLMSVTYAVANHGKIPAIIEEIRASIDVGDTPHSPAAVSPYDPIVTARILAAGDSKESTSRRSFDDWGNDEDQSPMPNLGGRQLYFRAVVTYRGPFTAGHETSVCWVYNESTSRFIGPAGGDQYNYEK